MPTTQPTQRKLTRVEREKQRKATQRARRGLLLKLTLAAAASFVLVQAATVAALVAVDVGRKRRQAPFEPFPHGGMQPIHLGENTLQIFTYGEDLYQDMLRAIDQAKDSIFLETYIWKNDELGQEFKDHLIRKAEEGVQVYCVFDAIGNLVVPAAFKRFPPSVNVLPYFPFRHPRQLLDPRRYALDHRKLLIVDDREAFVGGYNLGHLYATQWRDTHLRVSGPLAARLGRAFADFWNSNTRAERHITRTYRRGFETSVTVRGTDALRLTFPIRDMYLNGIENAEHHILLTSAYFIPDSALLGALKAAAARGVDVQVLVPWTSNHIVADWASHAYFTECLEAGIRIFGYQHAMIHAKTCTADSCITTIGTANLDRLSSVGNYEINVAIYCEELAKQMEKVFAADKTNAFELTLDDWQSRPFYVKLSEQIIKRLRFLL